ncbi:thiamine biosynthesis lipoprotein [Lutimaribacter pacificus]|uniref:FAD:protein FMN transferase n=1 Tax=Lutimaribacter pacificus TaxID=391948 RepID=A0A1H0IZW8_9RHOB|nr:FAD:protein FMN transferase [Lutimaribacter pacificus]SDO37024.1 thiamine biosynthesis lipoprotein [Lutimaribacter pacificus]SHK15649.1 thiamine biosynthesis lipoprotein [Lutimaribacter pacificus]
MSLGRRRFLTVTAAALAAGPALAAPGLQHWQGRALGADLRLSVAGLAPDAARALWRDVARALDGIERRFSLYRRSEVTRLNATGLLARPSRDFAALVALCDRVHDATDGAFDPTVQGVFEAQAGGRDPAAARAAAGWGRLMRRDGGLRLPPGAALTFNGIAQGWAADRIAALMRARGLQDVLIDMGEIAALGRHPEGRDWRAAIAGPAGQRLADITLRDRALATSSPMATRIGPDGLPHILHPDGRAPRWSTVAVSARSAALADALSTAFCLMDRAAIDTALAAFPQARIEAAAI